MIHTVGVECQQRGWSRQRNRERTCDRWEEDGDKSEKDVAAGHCDGIVEMKDKSNGVVYEW